MFARDRRSKSKRTGWTIAAGLVCLFLISAVSCRGPRPTAAHRSEPALEPDLAPYGTQPTAHWHQRNLPAVQASIPQVPGAEVIGDNQLCATCHESYVKYHHTNIHREQSCESCHGPGSEHMRTRGQEPGLILSFTRMNPAERSETCLQCHEQNACEPGARWRVGVHANAGVSCTDCHTGHYTVPPGTPATSLARADSSSEPIQMVGTRDVNKDTLVAAFQEALPGVGSAGQSSEPAELDMASVRAQSHAMGAITPHICYRCHANMAQQQNLAATHQVCGAIGFDCATCHDPHGKIRPETRVDLCLKCHDNNSPTMAWHSSSHAQYGVACTDCHNPHPNTKVQQVVNIQHTHVPHHGRSPMSVDEPAACYKCHAEIYAKNAMPSHHPIKEGKISCSDCHDPHGQTEDNLTEPTVNMVCYKCHAEKQGPFAYEHPPVTENCAICHDPHGTVTNNLLRQPTTFLCLRCHTGHRKGPNFHDGTLLQDIGTDPALQRAFYTDCTQCHAQVHGSDVPSPHLPNAKLR